MRKSNSQTARRSRRRGAASGSGEITAIELIVMQIDANSKRGTPEHAEAVEMLEIAKQMWREKSTKKCPHCGSRLTVKSGKPGLT